MSYLGLFDPSLSDSKRQVLIDWNRDHMFSLRRKFSYAIPTEEVLRVLCLPVFSPIVEIGAGTGYWAYLLRRRHVKIHAYDTYPPTHVPNNPSRNSSSNTTYTSLTQGLNEETTSNSYHGNAKAFTEVLQGDETVLQQEYISSCSLFLCWPPDEGDMSLNAVTHFKGEYVLYIGEFLGRSKISAFGNTGTAAFQFKLATDFTEILRIPLPAWPGNMDYFSVWKRVQPTEFLGNTWRYINQDDVINPQGLASESGRRLLQQSRILRHLSQPHPVFTPPGPPHERQPSGHVEQSLHHSPNQGYDNTTENSLSHEEHESSRTAHQTRQRVYASVDHSTLDETQLTHDTSSTCILTTDKIRPVHDETRDSTYSSTRSAHDPGPPVTVSGTPAANKKARFAL